MHPRPELARYVICLTFCVCMQLLQVLEDRQRPYRLEIESTTFTEATYVQLLLTLLRHEAPVAIALRKCGCADMPRWKRMEAYVLLSYHLWREGSETARRCVTLLFRELLL